MPTRAVQRAQSHRRLGLLALLGAAILLLVSAGALLFSLDHLRENRKIVFRTNSILSEVAEMHAALRAAESGQRGFLLSGERRYLISYQSALRELVVEFETLAGLVRHPAQVGRMKILEPLVEAKLAELADAIPVREREGGLETVVQIIRHGRERRLMERIDALISRFEIAERQLLSERVANEEKAARLTTLAAATTGVLSLLSAMLGLFLLFQQRSADALLRYSLQLEEQVAERTQSLSEANRELDSFAYTISHDLRAPLRAMHGYAEALDEDYGELLGEEGRGFVRRISAAGLRMNALIEDMLTYARLARDDIGLSPVALDALVERCSQDLVVGTCGK